MDDRRRGAGFLGLQHSEAGQQQRPGGRRVPGRLWAGGHAADRPDRRQRWLLATIAGTAAVGVAAAGALARRAVVLGHASVEGSAELLDAAIGWRMLANTVARVSVAALGVAALASLAVYTLPIQVAGIIAAAGLCLAVALRQLPKEIRSIAFALVNWQAIALLLNGFGSHRAESILQIDRAHIVLTCIQAAFGAAASLLVWQAVESRMDARIGAFQQKALRIAALAGLAMSLERAQYSTFDLLLAGGTFVALIATEFWTACRRQRAGRVWTGQVLILLAIGYFARARVFTFGHGFSMYLPLIAAIALRIIGGVAARRPTTAVLARPFARHRYYLPMATVVVAIARYLNNGHTNLHGLASLALFLAAGFYFWRRRRASRTPLAPGGRRDREHRADAPLARSAPGRSAVLHGAAGRVGAADGPALNREIPRQFHDPLRYAGALIVLVSPTFPHRRRKLAAPAVAAGAVDRRDAGGDRPARAGDPLTPARRSSRPIWSPWSSAAASITPACCGSPACSSAAAC
jgi:hypothetical protein